jgi:uncharacterized protein
MKIKRTKLRTEFIRLHGILQAAFLCLAISAGANGAALEPGSPGDPAGAEQHVGKVIWTELATPDLAAAKTFYSGMFAWTFRDMHKGDQQYAIAYVDDRPIAGLRQGTVDASNRRQPAWLTFLAVRDVDVARKAALDHGGKVLSEAAEHTPSGRRAVLVDPEGAVFAVLATGTGEPPDFLAEPGEWIWSSLVVRDPDKDAAFYQSIFDYEVFELPSTDGGEHLLLSTDDSARASVNSLPEGKARRRPHWLNFVRVLDAQQASARAVALGGRVLVEAHPDRHGGNVALIADPAGAPLGLMEWPAVASREEAR